MAKNIQKVLITSAGLEKIKKELDNLKQNKRPKTVDRVARARDQGDLSENSEYASAREELELLEARIEELSHFISLAQVPSHSANKNIISLGDTVVVDVDGAINEFTIVGSFESDPMRGKISNESLVGKALLGAKVGDVIVISSTIKTVYKIKEIK